VEPTREEIASLMPNEENDVSTENFKDEKIQELEGQL
jgi:hypothetical protein